MAIINTINIGNVVNDGLGDDLRTAFQKVNANFSTLNTELSITAVNLGETAEGVFKEKVGTVLNFKGLISGTKISLNSNSEVIEINNTAPDAFRKIDTDSGVIEATPANDYGHITFSGSAAPGSTTSRKDIEITTTGSTVYFKTIIPVVDILTSYDFGTISGDFNNSIQALYAAANMDFGVLMFDGLGNDLPSSTLSIDCGGIVV